MPNLYIIFYQSGERGLYEKSSLTFAFIEVENNSAKKGYNVGKVHDENEVCLLPLIL